MSRKQTRALNESYDEPPRKKRDYSDSWSRGYSNPSSQPPISLLDATPQPVLYGESPVPRMDATSWAQAPALPPMHASSRSYSSLQPASMAARQQRRKLTCELPHPSMPRRVENSKFGLGPDRYGNEQPTPLLGEFLETMDEMNDEMAFLRHNPEILARLPHACRLLDREVFRMDHCVEPEWVEVDINKPIYMVRRILIPVQRYSSFNFVGKIIGPKGLTLQNLSKMYKCHLNLLGEGSKRDQDRHQEQELFHSGDKTFLHFGLPLHLLFTTVARPHIAFMRFAGFLNALHKLLIPSHDIHLTGITDANVWTESDKTFLYEPFAFDEEKDEALDRELREFASANGATFRPRKSRGTHHLSASGDAPRFFGSHPKRDNDFTEDDFSLGSVPSMSNGARDFVRGNGRSASSSGFATRGGSDDSRGGRGGAVGAPRGRGRGRAAVPIRR